MPAMTQLPSIALLSPIDTYFARGVLLSLIICGLLSRWRHRHRQLPPGPRPYPVVGNIPHMTLDHPEKRFYQWKEKYGTSPLHLRKFDR